ncbi:MAG: hypothetical protein DI551_06970 [Micavibrio aeruginosavorus]|uniref:Acyltransferase n=1 Tax=Micavibrio aeruginosavorus TaxID=349221 RepID=A0A2W5MYW1_9BACT|nr:MAG: hypothetical protein DI551_06970 [Micavibrio aeruginosavorus]
MNKTTSVGSSLKYRPDIDGLRAIAVLLVLLCHGKFSAFAGGFVGVDIFFVISGYLITSIIYKSVQEGTFSVSDFYVRRIRRIMPALLTVLFVTTLIASLIFLPKEFARYGLSLAATASFSSNILFWRESGYFDASAWLKPLLHTWSLSIEEQFYIFFPIIVALHLKYLPRFFNFSVCAGIILSLALSQILLVVDKQAASYFNLPTRAWELLIGSALAIGIIPFHVNKAWANVIAGIGIILVLASGIFTKPVMFPGINALYPTIGAAMILYACGQQETFVSQFLSLKPSVFVGRISYSLYLWHWPVLVFSQYYLVVDISWWQSIILLLFSAFLAFLSWKYIEQPARSPDFHPKRLSLFVTTFFALFVFIALGMSIYYSKGMPQRFSPDVLEAANATKGLDKEFQKIGAGTIMALGDSSAKDFSFIVWGDSHANSISPAYEIIGQNQNRKGYLTKYAGCFPSTDKTMPSKPACLDFNTKVATLLAENPTIKNVYLTARWSAYPRWWGDGINPAGTPESLMLLKQGLLHTIKTMKSQGIDVVIMAEVPQVYNYDVASVIARNMHFGNNIDIRPTINDYNESQKYVMPILEEVARSQHIRLIRPDTFMCEKEKCDISRNKKTLYFDADHLSTNGARAITPDLERALSSPLLN